MDMQNVKDRLRQRIEIALEPEANRIEEELMEVVDRACKRLNILLCCQPDAYDLATKLRGAAANKRIREAEDRLADFMAGEAVSLVTPYRPDDEAPNRNLCEEGSQPDDGEPTKPQGGEPPSEGADDTPIWPARRLVFTFDHPNIGDRRFGPRCLDALREKMEKDPIGNLMDFEAENGVRVRVQNVRKLPPAHAPMGGGTVNGDPRDQNPPAPCAPERDHGDGWRDIKERQKAVRDKAGGRVHVFGEYGQWAITEDDGCLQFHPQWSIAPEKTATHIWPEAWAEIEQFGGFFKVRELLQHGPASGRVNAWPDRPEGG